MNIDEVLDRRMMQLDLRGRCRGEVLEELAGLIADDEAEVESDEIHRALMCREDLRTTGIGQGVAIPHARVPNIDRVRVAVGLSRCGVDFASIDGADAHIIFAVVAPSGATAIHLRVIACIAKVLNDDVIRARLLQCETPAEAHALLISVV